MLVSVLAACADPEIHAAERERELVLAMDRLDGDVVAARDAVVRGDLADARARAGGVLATLPPLPREPAGAERALRLALDDLSDAATIDEAAAAVGEVTTACASCHQGTGGDRPVWRAARTRPPEMARHAGDVDRLWVALIRPSEHELAAAVTAIEAASGAPQATGIDLRVRRLARDLLDSPPAERGAAYGALLAACADCHATGRSLSAPRLAGVTLPDLEDQMDEHYVSAVGLLLSVVGGDFAWIRRTAGELATMPDDPALPEVAAPYVADVRAAAQRALSASTVEDAARATGDLVLACGRCHSASGAGPKDEMDPAPAEPHMAVHVWGAYWMAYGLFAPDERAWTAGAEALATATLAAGEAPALPGHEPVEERVHAIGRRAAAVTDPALRAALWGELAATCSECHRRLAVR